MKPLLSSILLFLVTLSSLAFAQTASKGPPMQPILRIEAGGHTAAVNGVAVDAKGRFMATCSDDKSVRIWELPSYRLLRVLRPPLGATANEGKLNAIALSPDEKTIAVGGWTGWQWDGKASVYLFDRESGRLTRRIGDLPQVVDSLAFSPDGRRLAVGLDDDGLRAFDSTDGRLAFEDREYKDSVYGLSFAPDGRLAACAYDRTMRLYDPSGHTLAQAVRPEGGRPRGLAFSPDGSRLAVGDDARPDVAVLDGRNLRSLYSPSLTGVKNAVFSVAWSADGSSLYAAGRATNPLHRRIVRCWAQGRWGAATDVAVAASTVTALAPVPGEGVAFVAGDGLGTLGADGQVMRVENAAANPRGLGAGFRVARDGDEVRFAFAPLGKEPSAFSLAARALVDEPKDDPARPSGAPPRLATDAFAVTDWLYTTAPKLNGALLSLEKHEVSRSLAVLPDSSGLLLGTEWNLRLFERDAKQRWKVPAPSIAWAVNASSDGRLAVAAFGDGTVRWYRLADGKELLALYAHPDKKRWVLWTPGGYYDCSPGGEDLIGWNVNNGPDHEADFYPASRFRSTYYRPDVIAKILGTLDEAEAIRRADGEASRRAQTQTVAEILPPLVRIVGEPKVQGGKAILRYALRTPTDEPIVKLQFLVDGRTVKGETGLSLLARAEVERTVEIESPEGANLSVIASNRFGASEPATFSPPRARAVAATDPLPAPGVRPKLYVLAIGVGRPGGGAPELTFPAKDAKDFAAAILRQKGGLYEDVQIQLLTEAAATHDAIEDGLDWIVKNTTQHDVAMILVSGHGDNDPRGDYYFLPANFNPEHLSRTALYFSDLRKAVEALPGKTLLFVDTCHAGNALGGAKKRGLDDINGIVNELASAENGAVVFTACTGKETALEDPKWGNGAFTLALLECLEGRDRAGAVTITSLDRWIAERVKALTGGRQHPATQKPSTVPDFPLAIAGGRGG